MDMPAYHGACRQAYVKPIKPRQARHVYANVPQSIETQSSFEGSFMAAYDRS